MYMPPRSCSSPLPAAATPPASIPHATAFIGCYPRPPRPPGTRPDIRPPDTGSTMTAGGGDVRAGKRHNILGCSRARSWRFRGRLLAIARAAVLVQAAGVGSGPFLHQPGGLVEPAIVKARVIVGECLSHAAHV